MIFLLFIGINIIYSQKYAKNQFVVFSYKVDIDERVKKELNPYSDKIKYDLNKKHSKVEGMLVHSIYSIITKTLSDSLDIYFLTPNCFGDKIKYNDFGYPEIVIQKAIRLMDAKYFMKIDASIENSKFDEKGKKISEGLFLPVVNISIEIYNKF